MTNSSKHCSMTNSSKQIVVVLSLGFLVDLQDTFRLHCSDSVKLSMHGRHSAH